jgi:hypothetical protein
MIFDRDEVIEAFNYLDTLRESGMMNMFAAPKYLQQALSYSDEQAEMLFFAWRDTFDRILDVQTRADEYLKCEIISQKVS